MVLSIIVALLVVLGSALLLYISNAHQTAINQAHTTATTRANNNATAQAVQATDQANTATAQAIQATDQAATQAAYQETAQAQAQAIDQANTATAQTATAMQNPYPPNTGTLVINDLLSDNSMGYQWDESPTCVFTNGAYQVSTSAYALSTCTAQATNFTSNFVYQVDITIVQGYCGGITFFSQGDNFNYTYFEVCQDGSSDISTCFSSGGNTDCSGGGGIPPNSAVQTGLGQKNTLAVAFVNNNLSLYVNQQLLQLISETGNNVTGGKIGLLAYYGNASPPGEIVCSNVKVWTL